MTALWITLAVLAGLLVFAWWLCRPRPCWRCKRRPAYISIGEYWVCRQCWGEVYQEAEMLRAMFSDENVADNEIQAYFRERHK
jgi:hypothetical protein